MTQEITLKESNRTPLKINLQPHTVFLLCGPTNSGKSTFAELLRQLAVKSTLAAVVISSDKNRQTILGSTSLFAPAFEHNRYAPSMSAVSGQAFDLLFTQLEIATSFPVGSEIVIVDTTGMDEKFRLEVKKIADKNAYRTVLVTFEYKHRADYESEGLTEEKKKIIEASVIRFRRTILPSLKTKDFSDRIRIHSRAEIDALQKGLDAGPAGVRDLITDAADAKLETLFSTMDPDYPYKVEGKIPLYAVIGDSHECTEELRALVSRIETAYPGIHIVHIGDYLDKGGDTENMIEYMYERFRKGDTIVQGNHESYVVRKLRGELGSGSASEEVEKNYFTSLPVLSSREDLQKKLFEIFDRSYPFVILNSLDHRGGLPVFVTHAPCENRFIGKVHNFALNAQRNYRTKDRSVSVFEELDWLYKEASANHPLHIFGHVAHVVDKKYGERFKNKVFLDTGAVHGNCLTAVILKNGQIVKFETEKTKERLKDDLPRNLGSPVKKFSIEDYDLTPVDKRLMNKIMETGVRYISGTMAPSASNETSLEPLRTAIDLFRNSGADAIIAEPKYMGSRCQIYFFENDKDKTFAVSRKGWVIRSLIGHEGERSEALLKEFLDSEWEKRKPLMEKYGDLILDGELMPWATLGKSLIEESFLGYQYLVEGELSLLENDVGFKELTEFYDDYKLSEKKEHLTKFEEVLSRYSQLGPIEFKAFDILHCSREDPSLLSNEARKFHTVSSDSFFQLNLKDVEQKDLESGIERLHQFFQSVTVGQKMEGLVLKPLTKGVCEIPYIKVRSEEYLRLIYGYDYLDPERYEKLRRQKNVSKKIRISQSEAKIGYKLLVAEGDAKKELIVQMIGEMNKEQELDPRL